MGCIEDWNGSKAADGELSGQTLGSTAHNEHLNRDSEYCMKQNLDPMNSNSCSRWNHVLIVLFLDRSIKNKMG